MKIMTISVNADYSGAPIVAESYVKALQEHDHVCIFGKKINPNLFEESNKQYEIPSLVNSFNIFKLILNGKKIYSILIHEKPEIVICHSAISCLFGRLFWMKFRYKLFLVNHGWSWRGFNIFKSLLIKFIEYFLYFISKSTVVYLSEIEKQNSPRIITALSNSAVIQNTIIEKRNIKPLQLEKSLKQKLNSRFTIAMIARVDRSKNHQMLIDACKSLNFPINLVLVGEGTEELDSIRFNDFSTYGLGMRKDVFEILENSDVACLISNFETLPVSLIEACYMSKPIIATDVGSVSSIVTKKNGILVKNNIQSINNAITYLHDSKETRLKLGAESFQHYSKNFSNNKFKENVRSLVNGK